MINPTIINTQDQIYLANSPIHVKLMNLAKNNLLQKADMFIYIWRGNLNQPPTTPTHVYKSSKISAEDDYITFEISSVISSEIRNTMFVFNGGANQPLIRNEGVFFQIKYQIDLEPVVELKSNFATNGYRFDYEQKGEVAGMNQPYSFLKPIDYFNRIYSSQINYLKREFDFTKTLADCNSENIIKNTQITPTITKCHVGEKFLIVYLNRLGLFDYFTPFGKVVRQTKVDADNNNRLSRSVFNVNNSIFHSKKRVIKETEQSITINTGVLTEEMNEQIEEVLYSPLIYLIEFKGTVFDLSQVGISVDSTLITVDSTLYTVDNLPVVSADVGLFADFKQIPVVNENNDFIYKTRLNEKSKINYDLKFKVTTNKINDLV